MNIILIIQYKKEIKEIWFKQYKNRRINKIKLILKIKKKYLKLFHIKK